MTSHPASARLSASRTQREAAIRWLRPLGPIVLAVVVWVVCHTRPLPGTAGRGLAVTVALSVFIAGAVGVLVTLWRPGRLHVPSVVVVLAASVVLVWLQPGGAGIAGILVSVSLLAPVLRGHLSVPLTIASVLLLALVVATAQHGSLTGALLDAIMVGAFYGMTFLAIRFAEANDLAERLLDELHRSREAQARAAGLAERQRLAREMHDVLAHSLSGLMLQLEGARMLVAENPADPRLPEVVAHAHRLGKAGLDEARRAIGMLRDEELPGPERLGALAEQFERDWRVPCQFRVTGAARDLGSETRLALYRVAQEALTNIAKHARPERVELHLAYEPSGTRLTVEDFGAVAALPDGAGGYGLTGMRERAELLGGTLRACPTGTGFRVELDVPA